jgi:hypothetical protein
MIHAAMAARKRTSLRVSVISPDKDAASRYKELFGPLKEAQIICKRFEDASPGDIETVLEAAR